MPVNRDKAASLGLPAAVQAHPGFSPHIEPAVAVGNKKRRGIQGAATGRGALRGGRMSRATRAR